MTCYRDITYCASPCINRECERNLANAPVNGEKPILWADQSVGCKEFRAPDELK